MLEKDAQGTGPRGAARLGVVRNETRDALPFILIGKYNDRPPPPPPHREARVRTSGGTREKEERKEGEEGRRGDWVRLRTRVAAHLLRADSNCFPYLRTSTATL